VAVAQVQAALRRIFRRWGLPQRLRVDNGAPWATWADLPPAFALWLIGLGIEMIWNRPRSPQENAKVERCNGLIASWGDPGSCVDHAHWEAHLGEVVVDQRERYRPRKLGRPRLGAYPELATNPRRFPAAPAPEPFELARVQRWLAHGRWPRIVSKIGQITFYGKAHRVGRAWAGETVWLRFDAQTSEWVIEGKDGQELIRHAAAQITTARICALQVSHPRPPSRKKQRQNLAASP
jgi:transposase InsO family protein